MPARRSRLAAVLAVLALVAAVPLERGRGCAVCPADCPMHGARKAAGHVGCHQGGTHAAAPADDGGCAMRAGCGHHGGAELPAFHGELAAVETVGAPVVVGSAPTADDAARPSPAPHRLDRPPRSSVV